jgi:3-oxoacyl-[acyl-carrier protein] reductase
MKIQGKTALVTGASRGIGRAIAIELARHQAQRILLLARDRYQLQIVAAEIEDLGAEAVILALDLSELTAVNTVIAQAWRDYGPIDLLVNCAGIAHQGSFLHSKLSQVQEEIAINLIGLYTMTRSIARRMVAQRQGTIVNVSSLMGKIAAPTMSTYSATKFAIVGFTQALRSELSGYNIRVVALLPSLTETDMTRDLQRFRWVIPATPQQVAEALMQGLQQESAEILVGWQSHLVIWANRLVPQLVEQLLRLTVPPLKPPRKPSMRMR